MWILWTGLTLIFALVATGMAGVRGRSKLSGFVAGLLFGIFSILYYAIVGDTVELRVKKEEEARRKYRSKSKN